MALPAIELSGYDRAMAHRLDHSAIDPQLLLQVPVAVVGYGNQGRAQALNLRDSGFDIRIGQREGANAERAREEGFAVVPVAQATQEAEFLMLTLPDEFMGAVYAADMETHMRPGQSLAFSHGFAIRFGQIKPAETVDVILIAPKGQARGVRDKYLAGSGVPALVGVHQDPSGHAWGRALWYAWGCGYSRSLLLEASFAAETETDLFGEQTVLCGGMMELIKAGFEELVTAGYDPELAYFECVHETKLIVDLLVAKGFGKMRAAISDTAEWGGYQIGPKLVTEATRQTMREALAAIQSGEFAEGWVREAREGKVNLRRFRSAEAGLDVEAVGRQLRAEIEGKSPGV